MTWTTLACSECGYRPGGERTQYRHVETTGHTTFIYKPPRDLPAPGTHDDHQQPHTDTKNVVTTAEGTRR